jgi:hypothetical protein
MLPTAANLVKFGRKGQRVGKCGLARFHLPDKQTPSAISISKQEHQERV